MGLVGVVRVAAEAAKDAFREDRLSRAQAAEQRDDVARQRRAADPLAQGQRLVHRLADVDAQGMNYLVHQDGTTGHYDDTAIDCGSKVKARRCASALVVPSVSPW